MILLSMYYRSSDDTAMRVKDLGRCSNISPTALSRCLRQLEKEGLMIVVIIICAIVLLFVALRRNSECFEDGFKDGKKVVENTEPDYGAPDLDEDDFE